MSRYWPKSLSAAVISRSFHASNGEVGILPEDLPAFLDACMAEGIAVLGWELWLADHSWDAASNGPVKHLGQWSGLIPVRGETLPSVFSMEADLTSTRWQVSNLDLNALIEPKWLEHIRVNLTLD